MPLGKLKQKQNKKAQQVIKKINKVQSNYIHI